MGHDPFDGGIGLEGEAVEGDVVEVSEGLEEVCFGGVVGEEGGEAFFDLLKAGLHKLQVLGFVADDEFEEVEEHLVAGFHLVVAVHGPDLGKGLEGFFGVAAFKVGCCEVEHDDQSCFSALVLFVFGQSVEEEEGTVGLAQAGVVVDEAEVVVEDKGVPVEFLVVGEGFAQGIAVGEGLVEFVAFEGGIDEPDEHDDAGAVGTFCKKALLFKVLVLALEVALQLPEGLGLEENVGGNVEYPDTPFGGIVNGGVVVELLPDVGHEDQDVGVAV